MIVRSVRRSAALSGLVLASLSSGACGSDSPATVAVNCDGVELLVAASDYSESMLCGAPTRCERGPSTVSPELGKDPQLSISGGRAFFLARDNDRIYEVDPVCGYATDRYSIEIEGARGLTNPQDVAVAADGSLFVTLFNVPRVAIMKGGKVDGTIDLSTYDRLDGNPQANAIRIVDVGGVPKAFVTLGVLDDSDGQRFFTSKRPSLMLRIDVASRKVEASIELAGRNPFNTMAQQGDLLFFAEPGNFDSDTDDFAGIERFDTATSTTRLLVRERDLGGSVSEVAVTDACGVAIVAGLAPANPTALVTFDPASGQVLASIRAPLLGPTSGYDLQGLAWRGNSLFVGDRRRGGAGYPVHVFDRDPGTCNLRPATRTIAVPQRPVALRPAR